MSEPIEPPDPDLDDLPRSELGELDPMYSTVADVLDDWVARRFGITSSAHGVGLFLDLLAADGYRVTAIDPGPPIEDLLPVASPGEQP